MARNKRLRPGGPPPVRWSQRRWVSAAGAAAVAMLTALAGLVATPGTARAVAGGSVAAEGAYPFVAMVDAGEFGACSGVLVHQEWAVTVKSCLPELSAHVMPPPTPTTVTVGSTRRMADEVSRHPTLGVILLKLASPVWGVAPVAVGGAPVAGETLRVAGYGRTAQVWVPDRVHTATVTVGQVTDGGFTIAAAGVTTCQGDAGGAALREANGQVELVGLHDGSRQGGCLGAAGSDTAATEVRADRLGDWIRQHTTHPRPVPDLSRNLARDATFTASSSNEWSSWGLANINDGDRVLTGWTSWPAATSPRTESLEFAFPGGPRQVNRVDLYPRTDVPAAENNFPVNLTIKAWNGTAWETVVSRTNLPRVASGQRFTFPARSTNKLRIEGSNLTIMQLKEVEAYLSANLAADATFTASSSYENSSWHLANVNDTVRDLTGWTSWPAATSPRTEWLEFAFPGGAARQVNRVDLYPRTDVPVAENNFPANFTIQTWNGSAWETVVSKTNYPKPASGQRFPFPTKNTTKVRIVGTNLLIMQIKEVEAYLSGNVAADATVTTSSSGEFGSWRRIDVNDGIRDEVGWTSWPAATSPRTEWVELAFPGGAARQVNRVDLYPRPDVAAWTDLPPAVNVQVWTGSQWQTVVTRRLSRVVPVPPEGGPVPPVVRIAFPAQSTTKLRVEGVSVTIMQLSEVEAYHHFPAAAVAPPTNPLPSIVEKREYPGAAQILATANVELLAGDGHILFTDCATPPTGDIGLLKVRTTDATIGPDGIGLVCFKVTAPTGWLTLEVPGVYEIRGDGLRTGTGHEVTADLVNDEGERTSVQVDPDGSTPVGLGTSPDASPTMLLKLTATG